MSLKISCLKACDNNVGKAKELYDFLAEGVETLPDFDAVTPGAFEQVKQGATDIVNWLTSHKEDVAQGVAFVKSIFPGRGTPPAPGDIPPIPMP